MRHESNQLRLWFSSFAYALMQALRQHCLVQTELATAQCGTIRLKLLKVAAQIRISVRRVVIAISSYWTGQSLASSRLSTIAAGTSFGIIRHFGDNTYFGD